MYWPSFKMTLTQCLIWSMLKSQIFCRKGVKYQDLRILQLSIHSAWTMIKLHILNQAHIPWMLLAPFEASNLPMTFYIFTMLHTSWLNKHPFQKMIQLTTLGSQNRFNFFGPIFFLSIEQKNDLGIILTNINWKFVWWTNGPWKWRPICN